MTQGQIEKLAVPIQMNLGALESRVMSDIVRRIKINGEITSAADWQMNRLYQMGVSKKAIKKHIAESLGLNKKEIKKIYHDALQNEYIRNEQLYKEKGAKWVPFEKNAALQELIASVEAQTNKEMKNITQSLGFAIRGSDGRITQTPLMDFYQGTLDDAMADIASGAFDYNTVLNRTIQTMTNSGLRTIDYGSGWSNRVEVAGRRAVMTGFNQLQAKANDQVARQLKTEYFEVSWHGGARPTHQAWQGGVYSRKQLETVCGLGSVTGLCGANCYHQYNAFIPGASVRIYTDEQLKKMNAEENQKKSYNGREYTTYEALQQQRRMETVMRKQRQDIKLLKDGKAEDDILAAKVRYRISTEKYAEFSSRMKLPQQKERIYMDGLGRMISGKEKDPDTVDNSRIFQKNQKAAESWAKSHLGVKKTNYAGQPVEVVNQANRALRKIYRENPVLQNFVDEIEFKEIDAVAQAEIIIRGGRITTKLTLSPSKLSNGKEIQDMIDREASDGYWTPKKGLYGIAKHEATHLSEYALALKRYGVDKNTGGGDLAGAVKAIKSHQIASEIQEKALKNCNMANNYDTIKEKLCEYAASGGPGEFLAEACSEQKPRKLAKEAQRLFAKEMRK